MIKWVFNFKYLNFIIVQLILVVIFVTLVMVLSYLFVKKELKNLDCDEKRYKNEQKFN